MKIFNRASEAPKEAASPAPAPAAPASAAAQPQQAPAAPPPSDAPDLTAILDANVKEMSEKIARLTNTVETQQTERSGLEVKLEQMEDRMRKLSSLTEMISAQFNPFIGDAPEPREEPPAPEIGLAPPPATPAAVASLAPPELPTPESLSLDPFLASSAEEPEQDEAFHAVEPEMADWVPEEPPRAQPPRDLHDGIQVWSVAPGFESSLILLSWADMLLKSTGSRENLLEIVNYYHNIGWLGDPARDQLLGYADGIASPAHQGGEKDWRASFDVHEKSLLYVEKLKAINARRQA